MGTYLVDESGNYIGRYDDMTLAPVGHVAVPSPPDITGKMWNGTAWAWTKVAKSTVMARIIAAGKMSDAYGMLTANPVYFARWFAPDHAEINCDDADAIAFVHALGLDPQVILAP